MSTDIPPESAVLPKPPLNAAPQDDTSPMDADSTYQPSTDGEPAIAPAIVSTTNSSSSSSSSLSVSEFVNKGEEEVTTSSSSSSSSSSSTTSALPPPALPPAPAPAQAALPQLTPIPHNQQTIVDLSIESSSSDSSSDSDSDASIEIMKTVKKPPKQKYDPDDPYPPSIHEDAPPSDWDPASMNQRKSQRDRVTTTVKLAGGYIVKKANNYRVSGTGGYIFDETGSAGYEEVDSDDDEHKAPKFKKIKVARLPGSETETELENMKRKEMLSVHIDGLKVCYNDNMAKRSNWFADRLVTAAPFLEQKMINKLTALKGVNEATKARDGAPRPLHKEIMFQPDGLLGDLRDYQLIGLNFLVSQHVYGINSILGDEMGLGKTIQTIAYLLHLKENLNQPGPSLIVCPLSVLSSWTNECKKWAPYTEITHLQSGRQVGTGKFKGLNVLRLHDSNPDQREINLRKLKDNFFDYDCVLTTYDMLKTSSLSFFLGRYHFRAVVLDEGHIIKNAKTDISMAVRKIHSQSRLILTGTPLQNNLTELWSLLNYLSPEYFVESTAFDEGFDIQHAKVNKSTLEKACALLKMFMLRRLKSEVEKLMPLKVETIISCPLSACQIHWYKSLLLKDMSILASLEGEAGKEKMTTGQITAQSSNYKQLNNLVMQLRKCCNHPFLFPNGEEDPDTTSLNDLIGSSGKLAVLDLLLCKLHKEGHRVCLFSQFTRVLDIIDDYCRMRGWRYTRLDGSTARVARSVSVDRFNAPGSSEFLFLMSTRAGGMGLNLQSADTCILYDSDWNPQPDLQAMARVHRIGQTKTVHVYRMISAGTVEERIVERAQKKLYLDRMVNSGDARSASQRTNSNGEEEDEDEATLSARDLLETLKFGSDAVFGNRENVLPSASDINVICDRSRTGEEDDMIASSSSSSSSSASSSSTAGSSSQPSSSSGGTLKSAQQDAREFDATSAMSSVQQLNGVDFKALKEKVAQDKLKSQLTSMNTIADGWKRNRKQRIIMVQGKGTGYGGMVPVLASNNYALKEGEQSVFSRELSNGSDPNRGSTERSSAAVIKKGKKVITWENQDFCQGCGDGGALVLCDKCPVSAHEACIMPFLDPYGGKKNIGNVFACTHHKCIVCYATVSAAGGLLFRCQSCLNCFCEECLPEEGVERLERCERMMNLDYHDKNSLYIHCTAECREIALKNLGWTPPNVKKIKTPVPLDLSSYFGKDAQNVEDDIDNSIASRVSPEGGEIVSIGTMRNSEMRKIRDHGTAGRRA